MKKILVVDDEKPISDIISFNLENEGYAIEKAYDGEQALEVFEKSQPDLVILDLMLPKMDGLEVCREIRKQSAVPVIMLTAKDSEIDKVLGLELGADDYIIKPFRPRDLELRILSILKRAYPEKEDTLVLPACQVHFSQALITKGKLEIQLTAKEYSILKVLYDNKNRIVTFDQLLEKVWGLQYQGYDNTLMAHIRKIRQKIEANPSKPESLITVKGLGYKLKVN